MKVNTVEQFKVLQFLEENLEIELFKLELLDRYSIQVTDSVGNKMIFKWVGKKETWDE
ncbi:MAG: hypothetical protein E6916_01035 [Clostridium cochlearium]|uniref:Uncharacterized protein n=1 Tax=Clostridium cochlearium TaxID=1494 RepID=A0A2X2YA96_CLOCO|nr:hypothetical protein [Clostridium cochlearium]MDU1442080.1 hypothetical protein [Clostridium cochlearium]SQB35480.1 Uncharacterised protein [Clostridium cochlearium]